MTVKLSYAILTGGLLLGLSGCSSGGGLTHETATRSTPTVTPNRTQNTTPNRTTNQNRGNTQTTPNRTTTNQNSPATFTATSATAFVVNTRDSKALNITRVVRPTGDFAKEIQKALENTNKLRAEKGIKPLRLDEGLTAFAQMRANEIVVRFDHARLSQDSIFEPFTDWLLMGENIAAGSQSADQTVLVQWRNSEGHYGNMVNPVFETIGIGLAYDPNSPFKYYWVQMFGTQNIKSTYQFVDGNKDNSKPLTQIVVDGRNIPINLPTKGQWTQINTNGHQGWVNGYDHTRFGVATPANTNQTYLFYQGNQTANGAIPKSGTANYNGTGLVVKDGKTNTNIQSQFTANFGTRKLNGTLSQNNATLYTISADINGSGFASKKDAPVQTQGAFFGQNAQELAGVFKDTKTDARGVYGAKKIIFTIKNIVNIGDVFYCLASI